MFHTTRCPLNWGKSSAILHRYPAYRRWFRATVAKGALLVGSTLFTLCAVEAVLHFAYKDIQVGGATSPSHFTFYRKYYRHNQLGFRDKERTYENLAGRYRILVLGDSFTYGAGVKFIEDLYPSRLEERLNQSPSAHERSFEVINTGLKGLSTAQEFHYLQTKGIRFKPDFLIVGLVLNDAETPEMKRAAAQEADDWQLLPNPYGRLLNKYSFAYFFLRNRLWTLTTQSHNAHHVRSPFLEELYSERNVIAFRSMFNEFMSYCRAQDLPVLVVLFPKLPHVRDEHYPYLDIHEIIQEIVLSNGTAFIDLLGPLRNSHIERFTVSSTDGHPSKEVHHFVADSIYHKLISEDVLP